MGTNVACRKGLDFRLDKCVASFTEGIPAKMLFFSYKVSEYICSVSNVQ